MKIFLCLFLLFNVVLSQLDFLSSLGGLGGGGGGNPLGALTGGGGGGNPLGALGNLGGGGNPFGALGNLGGDPFAAFSKLLPGGSGGNPLDMITQLFSGKGGGDLLSMLSGGSQNPLDFMMNTLGGEQKAGGELLNMFTPQSDTPPAETKRDCLKQSAEEQKGLFGGFLDQMPKGTTDQLFGNMELCQEKKEENAWQKMNQFLRKPPKDLLGELTKDSRKQCRKALAIERNNCKQMERTMCSMLSGQKGLEPQNIMEQMKKVASQGTKSATAEKSCESVEKVLNNKDPSQLGNIASGGIQDLIFGGAASGIIDGLRKKK